jgi:hypothetical protein
LLFRIKSKYHAASKIKKNRMNLEPAKVEDIRAHFQHFGKITDAKLQKLIWVLSSLFEARSACLYKCAQENAFVSPEKTEFKQRYDHLI